MSIPSQRKPHTRKRATSPTAMSDVIAETRGRLGRDERFRVATRGVAPGKAGPLLASFDEVQVVYQRTAKSEGEIAKIVSTKEDGSILEAIVGEGSRVTVQEELVIRSGGLEAVFDAQTTTRHTIDHIGAPTTVIREETTGLLTIKEGDRIITTRNPRRARRLTKELF